MSRYKVVLFDLDGTLIDTSKGIFNSVRHAEKMMKFTPVGDEQLKQFVGPPPMQAYMKNYGVTEALAREATKYHRQYGAKYGIYEAEVYKGIDTLLANLKKQGIKTGVCTLKRQDIAEKVLEYFGLLKYFDVIVGIDQQESLTKADTIDIALNVLEETNKKNAVLIGDSIYDAEGAEEAGVDFIGVLYGFGFTAKEDKYQMVAQVADLMNALREEE